MARLRTPQQGFALEQATTKIDHIEARICQVRGHFGRLRLWTVLWQIKWLSSKYVSKSPWHRPNDADKMIGHNTALKRAAALPVCGNEPRGTIRRNFLNSSLVSTKRSNKANNSNETRWNRRRRARYRQRPRQHPQRTRRQSHPPIRRNVRPTV
jgi:hypothetical protein